MLNQNIIDISELSSHDRALALDFFEFLKVKNKPKSLGNGNFDKAKLLAAFEKARDPKIFKNIEDSVAWQREIRDEWE